MRAMATRMARLDKSHTVELMRRFIVQMLMMWPVAVLAATAEPDTLHHIDEVVVTSRLPQREILPPQKLTGKQLEQLNSHSVADALRYFSGVQLKDYGGVGGIKTVDIRSMGSQHVGVYYDGIELGNAQNGQIDLGQFSLDNIGEITIYNGQKSAIFQSATDFGNAGNVYIRTRLPRFTGDKDYNIRMKAKYGASNTVRLSGLWEQRLTETVNSSLNAEFLNSDGHYKFSYKRVAPDGTVAYDTTATRQNGDVHAERVELNVNGIIDRGFWNAKAYLYNSERGIPGAIVNNVWRRGERQNDLNTFVQARMEKDVSDRFSTQWMAKYAYYRTHYINRDTTQLPADNRYWQQEAYVSSANVYELLKNWSVSAAVDLRWNKLNADTYRFVFPTRLSTLVSVASALELPWLRVQGSVLATFVHDHLRSKAYTADSRGSRNINKLTPAIFISLPLMSRRHTEGTQIVTNELTLKAFAKRSFRMPTFNDLYYTDVGNSNLRPEGANQYDIGIGYGRTGGEVLSRLSLQADLYYNTVGDKIIAYPKGQQFRWTMLNLGRVHITGVDLAAGASLSLPKGVKVETRLTYTYQDARDVTNPQDSYYKDQIPYVPYNSGSATVNASWRGLTLNYSFIYSGDRWNGQENTQYNHMEPWYTHDVSLQYEWREKGKPVYKFTFEINNLLDQKYDVIQNYPMPGINCAATISVEL